MIIRLKQKKIKFKPRIKLNHNIYTARTRFARVRVCLCHSWPLFFTVCLSLAKQMTTLFYLKRMSVFLPVCMPWVSDRSKFIHPPADEIHCDVDSILVGWESPIHAVLEWTYFRISHISFLLSVLEKRIESRTVVARIYQSLVFIVGLCSLMILKPCSPMEFAYSDERNRSYCNLAVVLITPLYRNTFKKLVYYMAFRTFTLICVVHHALEQP